MFGLNLFAIGLDFLDPFEIYLHILHVNIISTITIWYDFIVHEQIVYVRHEIGNYVFRNLNGQIQHQRPAEIPACLHEVGCAEVIVFIWAHVITTERRFNSIDGWAL